MSSSRNSAHSHHAAILAAVIGALGLTACQAPGPAASAVAPQPQPAAPILSSDHAAFIGLGERDLADALGRPRQVRKDAPAEIWQYGGADCVVDFYLYDEGGRMIVAFVEARDLGAENASAERCVRSLMQSVSAIGVQ